MAKMKSSDKLLRYLKGELSQEEAREIEIWADESKENEKELLSVARVYNLGIMAREHTPEEIEAAWKTVCVKAGVKAPEKTKQHRHLWLRWSAVAAIVALLCLNAALMLDKVSEPEEEILTLASWNGNYVTYTLTDGTKVTLNKNSILEFPVAFNSRERRVKLVGEGYFDVTKDSSRPFVVETDKDISVKVLGTTFNLQSYASDDVVQVALIEGSVEVSGENGASFSYLMHPSERFTYDVVSGKMSVDDMVGMNGTEWMYGRLIFCDDTLTEVARQLTNHFGMKVFVDDSDLARIRFSGSFDNHSLDQVLLYMEQACGIRTEKSGNGIHLKKR